MRNEFPQPFGPYELLRRLGRGGMAEVFLALAPSSHGEKRLVALKRMHGALSEDPSAVEMLVQEARLAMRFQHECIAQTFELGCHEGAYYFIMEYVDGVDLGTITSLIESRNTRLDPAPVAYLCARMARGLSHAHELRDENEQFLGIVHRDVSPQNVLIGRHGEVKIIDFGVAKVASRIQQTMAGIIKGKYAYMSPEQASAETVDARSDLFSIGICMYELLSGQPLFRGIGGSSPYAILRAVRDEPIPPIHKVVPGLPHELSRIVHKALERRLSHRYQSAAALANDLEAWLRRHAPRFDALTLQVYVRKMLDEAPAGSVPQNAIATPPLAKMRVDEFLPSQMSVVASSPFDAPTSPVRPPALVQPSEPAPSPGGGRSPSMLFPRSYPGLAGALGQSGHAGVDARTLGPAFANVGLRPSRRRVLQVLWVGVIALLFALGWSTIATLVKIGGL
ncbi:MAG: serine/threonine protein kinase [Myxococcota bacterium]